MLVLHDFYISDVPYIFRGAWSTIMDYEALFGRASSGTRTNETIFLSFFSLGLAPPHSVARNRSYLESCQRET